MKIVFSGSNDFCRWFGGGMPRYETPDKNRVGRLSLRSDDSQMIWQCQYLDLAKYRDGWRSEVVVIAVEMNSRTTVIVPVNSNDKAQFEDQFLNAMIDAILPLCVAAKAMSKLDFLVTLQRFDDVFKGFEWVRNTDLSVSGNVADVQQWLKAEYDESGSLARMDLLGLQDYLNQQPKRVKVSDTPKRHKKVVPMNVVADYWMNVFSGTPDQQTQGSTETKPLASNVICMEAFKKIKK
ncbi:MAG: hypothetical protein AB7C96_11205 [Hydrogenovibrio sp.]|jgi:hypothetical protein